MIDAFGQVKCQFCNHKMLRIEVADSNKENIKVIGFQCIHCHQVKTLEVKCYALSPTA